MSTIKGNTSGSIKSIAYGIPSTIKSFSLWNRSGAPIVVNIGIVVAGTDRYIFSANLTALGSAGSSTYQQTDITVPSSCQILITTNGSVDYYFSIT